VIRRTGKKVVRGARRASASQVDTLPRGVKVSGVPKGLASRVRKVHDFVVLDLNGVALVDAHIDARDIGYIPVGNGSLTNVVIENMVGDIFIEGDARPTICRNLTLRKSKVRKLTTQRAVFAECVFEDVAIAELWSTGSVFWRCHFSGKIDKGLFSPGTRDTRLQVDRMSFEENDFSQCDLRDVDFRGGVELPKQKFSQAQAALIVSDGPLIVDALERFVEAHSECAGAHSLLKYFRRAVTEFEQRQVFVSKQVAKNVICKHLADLGKRRSAVSAEFAAWVAEIDEVCE
jgi:hypothetical protein